MAPEALAALHARCFDAAPRPWSADEFRALLAEPSAFLVGRGRGFALGREAGGEAELLTLAVAPEARRRGIGRALLAAFEQEAQARGATVAFLEVAETNRAARALYEGAGWSECGFRRDYYAPGGGVRVAALVLRKAVGGGGSDRVPRPGGIV